MKHKPSADQEPLRECDTSTATYNSVFAAGAEDWPEPEQTFRIGPTHQAYNNKTPTSRHSWITLHLYTRTDFWVTFIVLAFLEDRKALFALQRIALLP